MASLSPEPPLRRVSRARECFRSAIEELSNRTADVAQRRVVSLQKAPRELQEEWRAAKDEFSEHKLKLIDKETKKRMLEELWHDRVDIPPEEAQQAEREMQAKKAAVTTLKKANQQRREGLREQAVNFANGVAAMREREAALASQVRKAEEANVAADEQRAKTSAHAAAAGRSRERQALVHHHTRLPGGRRLRRRHPRR